jgi:hypothetical protein
VDDYVQINPQSPITPFNQSRTVSIWFKPNVFPTSNYSEIIITGNQYNPTIPMWEINLAPNNGNQLGYGQLYSDGGNLQGVGSLSVLDSPATTSSTAYTVYFASTNGGTVSMFHNSLTGTIALMEIAA